MQSFEIRIHFRKERLPAIVHKHEGFYHVWFSVERIFMDFGGLLWISADYQDIRGQKTEAKDVKDFHNAIITELKRFE